jgi:hypothetical protein
MSQEKECRGVPLSSLLSAPNSAEYQKAYQKAYEELHAPSALPSSLECPIVQSLEDSFRREIDALQAELDAARGKKREED